MLTPAYQQAPARLSRETKARIRRRANALAEIEYGAMVAAMEQELLAGRLQAAEIETWNHPQSLAR